MLEPFDPEEGITVLAPDAPGAGNWVGCPSVLFDPVRESVLLTYRRRRPRGGPPPDRDYECAFAESRDGVRFTELWTVRKEALGSTWLERCNLQRTDDGRYLLYVVRDGGRYLMFVSTFLTAAGPAPTCLAVSDDGSR